MTSMESCVAQTATTRLKGMKKPKISILLAAYKSEELLDKIFIPSLKNWTCDWELIIRDNGGNGDLDKYKSDLRIKIIGDGLNKGLNAALNECATIAKGDYYYLPHSDMVLMPGSDTTLLQAAKGHAPGSFLFCSRSVEKASHIPMQVLKDFGTTVENFKEKELYDFFETYKDKGIVTGCRMPMFLDKTLWKKLENFSLKYFGKKEACDSNYFSYATDNEIIINSYHIGIRKFWLIQGSLIYHLSGHSNKQQTVDRNSNQPYDYLKKKWKKFGYEINDIDQFEQSLFPWNFKIK